MRNAPKMTAADFVISGNRINMRLRESLSSEDKNRWRLSVEEQLWHGDLLNNYPFWTTESQYRYPKSVDSEVRIVLRELLNETNNDRGTRDLVYPTEILKSINRLSSKKNWILIGDLKATSANSAGHFPDHNRLVLNLQEVTPSRFMRTSKESTSFPLHNRVFDIIIQMTSIRSRRH